MGSRHDAVFDDVLRGLDDPEKKNEEAAEREGKPRGGNRFLKRSNALADRVGGDIVEQTLRWVDPARCRMWERHNRRYELLSEHRCADLIEGFKAQGRQEFPAIVRRIEGDPDHDYEVICGARRHWTVSWLRSHNYLSFRFLIEERNLTDEEAFRLSDIENRDREDISDYERAVDYSDALTRYYEGKQKNMAERLEVSEAWLSRYLWIAKLPKPIVEAYADVTHIREHHARELKPFLNHPEKKKRIIEAAKGLRARQKEVATTGGGLVEGPSVLAALKAAAVEKHKPQKTTLTEYKAGGDKVVMTVRRKGRGLTLDVAPGADIDTLLDMCRRAFDEHLKR